MGGWRSCSRGSRSAAGAALRSRPQVVALKVSTVQGASLFDSEVHAIAPPGVKAARTIARWLRFRPGACSSILSIRAADGSVLDTGAQDIDVPVVRGTGPVLLQPQFVRARTVRDFRALSPQPDAAPTPSRIFSRSERLLIRVPAYNPDGAAVTTSVSVSNIKGETIRALDQVPCQRRFPCSSTCPSRSWRQATTVSRSR